MRWFWLSVVCLLISCTETSNYAPVTEVSTVDPIPISGQHRVKAGETLYAIAWRYGLDYRDVAVRNHIVAPYYLRPQQMLYLQTPATPQPNAEPVPTTLVKLEKTASKPPRLVKSSQWQMPAQGKILSAFSGMNKGINIVGQKGDAIVATAGGQVVYAGNGLRGYGNLIIVKHNAVYLSAYAHNSKLLVKEGDTVSRGQKIAEMGDTASNRVMLHFEIRRAGKPIDPLAIIAT